MAVPTNHLLSFFFCLKVNHANVEIIAATSKVNNELAEPTESIKPYCCVPKGKSAYTHTNPCLTQKPNTYNGAAIPTHFRIEERS